MTSTQLLIARIQHLQKKPADLAKAAATLQKHRLASKKIFEERFHNRLTTHQFKPGDLVLKRNNAVEKELNKKSKPRYLGPYQVVRMRTHGFSYVLQGLDGTVLKKAAAAFQLIPYISRHNPRLKILDDETLTPPSSANTTDKEEESGTENQSESESD